MKTFLTVVLLTLGCLSLTACSTHTEAEFLVGRTTQAELFRQYADFNLGYQQFNVSKLQQQQIQNWPDDIKIDVFFGTWCHDSQREVPKFLKLLAYNADIQVNLIALDYRKTDPKGLAERNAIKYTPTFVVYRHGKEIGRIIERANESLLSDLNNLLVI